MRNNFFWQLMFYGVVTLILAWLFIITALNGSHEALPAGLAFLFISMVTFCCGSAFAFALGRIQELEKKLKEMQADVKQGSKSLAMSP
jgi:TRAP-type C4-dicarboxylate transport system permease small subunit